MPKKLLFGLLALLLVVLVAGVVAYFRFYPAKVSAPFSYPVSGDRFKAGFEFQNQGQKLIGFPASAGPVYAAMEGKVWVRRTQAEAGASFDIVSIQSGGQELVYLFASAGTLVPDGQVVQKGQLMASTAGQALLYFAGVLESGTPGLVLLRRQGGQTVDLSLADFGPHRGPRPEAARDLAVVPPEATTQELAELLGTQPLEFASPPVEPSMFTEAIPVFVGGQPFIGISPAAGTTVLAVTPGVIDVTEVADESGFFSNIFILGADGTSIRYMLTGSPLVVDGDSVVVGQEIASVGEATVPIEVDGGGRYRLLVGGQDATGYPISITPDSFLPK